VIIDNPYTREELLVDDGEHAVLNASGHSVWDNCPGSVVLCHGIPNTDTSYSKEGTVAHIVGDECLSSPRIFPKSYLRKVINGIVVEQEMVDAIVEYRKLCNSLGKKGTGFREVEMRVRYSEFIPGGYGTGDFVLIDSEGTLYVVDLKYGQGVWVYAVRDGVGNGQLLLYALGVWLSERYFYNIEKIVIIVCQPRLDNIATWECTVDELLEFAEATKIRAERIFEPQVELIPGEAQCRFCPAADRCPALHEQMADRLSLEFDDLDANPLIDNDTLAADILPHLDQWQRMISKYRELAHAELLGGKDVGDWKLVMGKKGNKAWNDPDETAIALKNGGFNEDVMVAPKLKTPTQVLKLIGLKPKTDEYANFCTNFVHQAPGKPVLAPGSDPRDALQSYADDFKEEDHG
jgi:hypothetical protein